MVMAGSSGKNGNQYISVNDDGPGAIRNRLAHSPTSPGARVSNH